MAIEKFNIFLCLLFIFIIACSTNQLKTTVDSCIIFEQKNNWYKATKKSYDKWGSPISYQLAIVKHESSFKQFAKPKRNKILGFIPGKRPSTAFGYAQVTNPTWEWYKQSNDKKNASRANFYDITDFIGWYSHQSFNILGIDKKDFYNQYLAYHEGQGGWKRKSFKSKKWLIEVAKKVEITAKKYNNQLIECESSLDKKGFFGIL